MAISSKYRIGTEIRFPGGDALQTAYGSGTRATVTASVVSTAAVAVPAGARLLYVRSTGSVWLRFGSSGVAAADASDSSVLFPAGESVVPVPLDASREPNTHFRVLRAGSDDCFVQLESIPHVEGA